MFSKTEKKTAQADEILVLLWALPRTWKNKTKKYLLLVLTHSQNVDCLSEHVFVFPGEGVVTLSNRAATKTRTRFLGRQIQFKRRGWLAYHSRVGETAAVRRSSKQR